MSTQLSLALPAPPATGDTPLVPVRMVNEWVYCPRLAYLMWVDGEWSDTGDTEDGRRVHARADRAGGRLPPPGTGEPPPFAARSVTMSSERLGLIARMDVIEGEEGSLTPVDYKRGRRPHVEKGAWEPERVQVCAQALILEDQGYRVAEGALWFAESRERVRVELDAALRETTLRAIADLRLTAAAGRRPPPLENSPKCPRCALAAICLPDEVRFFDRTVVPRLLAPDADAALPLHVQTPGARIRRSGEMLVVETDEAATEVPLTDVSELILWGPVSLTTPALHELLARGLPVSWHSSGGWFLGQAAGIGTRSVDVRLAQFRLAADPAAARRVAAGLVAAKVRNQRTMLRRNWKRDPADPALADALERLGRLAEAAPSAPDADRLLGIEGEAAALYFAAFPGLFSPDRAPDFDLAKRNRRPPEDPVNALLSYAYALLLRALVAPLAAAGFDPSLGFLHRPRHGRPALALDMMEPFRPLLADSAVLMAVNNGEVTAADFVRNGPACALKPAGRKALIAAWERRLDQETTHPVFGYRLSTRRLLALQCRLLARHVMGEIPDMPHYVPR
jgi:CRISPR-associated exonuclease Cas4/CRISPR-associated protein Cas1